MGCALCAARFELKDFTTMADQENPVFQIQRVYLKDMSLEQPNSPAILLEQEQPSVDTVSYTHLTLPTSDLV